MTFGGNTKQRFSFWAATASFIAALLCTVEATTGGDIVYKGFAVLAMVVGIIFFVGVWATGLPRAEDADKEA